MANIIPTYVLPNEAEVVDFVNRAEDVSNAVRNILNGSPREIVAVEIRNNPIITKSGGNDCSPQTKEDTTEGNHYVYKEGVGDTGNYCYYCVSCRLMYYYETLTCARCNKALISKEERIKELQEKVRRYKQEKEERNKRRQKWEELKNGKNKQNNSKDSNSTSARSALPNYDKWAYFEPDSDSDLDTINNIEVENLSNVRGSVYKGSHKEVLTNVDSGKNSNQKSTPNISCDGSCKSAENQKNLMENMVGAFKKTIETDLKKRKQNREAALRLKLRGNEFTQQKQYLKAIECYEDGINLDNSCVELYTNLALCLIKTYQFEKAIRTCDTVLKYLKAFSGSQPVNSATMFKAYSRKGLALYHLHRHEEALCCFNKSILYDAKDEMARRYIFMCYAYIENKKAVKYFVNKQKKVRRKHEYRCPVMYPWLTPCRKYCCKSIIGYLKMTEEQVLAMKPEDFVSIEGIAATCDNTEILLHFESDIKKELDENTSNIGKSKCSVFVCTLMKMLCTYMNKINQVVHGDVLKNQNVNTNELHIDYADMKIKAEHIIGTLGSLAQKNPLHLDFFIDCVKPVLIFYALQFVNCHNAMFFLGTIVRNVKISNEIRKLIKNCTTFWDVYFKMLNVVCTDFSTLKEPRQHVLAFGDMLELAQAADVKRNYCNYLSFLGKICLEHEVNSLLTHTYADNMRKLCRYINDQLQKRDTHVFYYMEVLTNLYLGGGHMKDEILKTCWDGVMHVLKKEKDKVTILTVLNFMDILTFSWTYGLSSYKASCVMCRKVEADVFENIVTVWKRNGQEKSPQLIKILSCFVKHNCHLEKDNLPKEIQDNDDAVSGEKRDMDDMVSGNRIDTCVNFTMASNTSTGSATSSTSITSSTSSMSTTPAMSTTSATYVKEPIDASETTDFTSSKGLTQTSIITEVSTTAKTTEPLVTVNAPTNNTSSTASNTLERRNTDDDTLNVQNNAQVADDTVYDLVDFRTVNILIPVIYGGLNRTNPYNIHKECAVVLALLSEYLVFFQCTTERKDITIVNFVDAIVDVFNVHENWFKQSKNYNIVGDMVVFFNHLIRNVNLLKDKKQNVIDAMEPLVVKLIHLFSVVQNKPFKQALVIMFSLILLRKLFPDLVNKYNLRRIIMTDGYAKSMMEKHRK